MSSSDLAISIRGVGKKYTIRHDYTAPNRDACSSCCSGEVIDSTSDTAASWSSESAEMPQHWVNRSVPLPAGPSGSPSRTIWPKCPA